MNVKVPKHEKKKRGRLLGRLVLIVLVGLIGFGVWYFGIRDVEPEENVIQQPTLSIPGSATADATATEAATNDNDSIEATATTDETAEDPGASADDIQSDAGDAESDDGLEAPSIVTDVDNYRVYAFDLERSLINFTIEATSTKGKFDLYGHWFEFIYEPQQEGWRMVLWFDIDGRSVDTGNALVDQLIMTAFQAERYPVGRFVGETELLLPELTPNMDHDMIVLGELELSGQVRPLEVPITFRVDGEGVLSASANVVIDAADYGADFPESLGSSELDGQVRVVAIETDPADITMPELPNTTSSSEDTSE